MLIGGCSGATPGTASPAPSANGQSQQSLPPATSAVQVPPVPSQLKVDKFLADPCSMLTAQQLSTLKLSKPERDSNSTGISCAWQFGDGYTNLSASFLTSVPNGLTNAYSQKAAGYYASGYFEPTSINGFPAVLADSRDRRDQGHISMLLGLSDKTEMLILIQASPGTNVKAGATNFAKAIVSTIQGAQ
ncbi:DUF3558 domain-containing protein [Amycolatopsis benzoatilytica]|uniref:DUF3558 domain-containing protein n=1 Tax=Amycolatopsis benzoatilytica TaxID=346045 RepID=UPI000A01248F|nr:DUF3558 domain-containing protein [Amycolatopsis benzoatilytica]